MFLWQTPALARDRAAVPRRLRARRHPRAAVVDRDGRAPRARSWSTAWRSSRSRSLPTLLGLAGPVYFAVALVLGLGFLWSRDRPRPHAARWRDARRLLLASLIYLPVLLAAMALDKLPDHAMTARDARRAAPARLDRRDGRAAPAVSNARLAIVIVIAAETMFFAGLIGAYLVFRLGRRPGRRPTCRACRSASPRSTRVVLFASVVPMTRALRGARRATTAHGDAAACRSPALLGALFLAVQGVEWAAAASRTG